MTPSHIRFVSLEVEGDADVIAGALQALGEIVFDEPPHTVSFRCDGRARVDPAPPLPPHRHESETSAAAARRIAPRAGSMRERVYAHVVACGPRGATRAEIVAALAMKENTTNGRCAELVRAGRLVERGQRGGRAVLVVASHPSPSVPQ